MLRSLSSRITGRFRRPDVVNNEHLGGQSNPTSAATREASASEPESSASAPHVVAIEFHSGEPSTVELGEASTKEVGQSNVNRDNSEWLEVDLSGQRAESDVPCACASHSDTVNSSQRLIDDNNAVARTNSAFSSRVVATDVCTGQQQQHDATIIFHQPLEKEYQSEHAQQLESSNFCLLQQGIRNTSKTPEAIVENPINGSIPRTGSAFSTDSLAEYCRICQQPTDEPLIELGCHCRGELSKTHRSCIQQWFNNKGTNKCEVCQHEATNLPPPAGQPRQRFWTWRISRPYGQGSQRFRRRFHPLWAALLILVAGLLFDVLISYYLGASALPVNIIIGVLVVLGLGTAARLVVECCREQSVRRSIRQMEIAADMDQLQSDNRLIGVHLSA